MKADTRKSVTVTIRFFQDSNLVPKKAYDYGMIALNASEPHGIRYIETDFKSLLEIMVKLDKLLKEQGVSLHHNDMSEPATLGLGY